MAFDFLRANAKRIGLDRDVTGYDFNLQVMSPMHGKESDELGIACYVALLSALTGKPLAGGMVVLGAMTIHGVLSRVEQLGDRLRVALDAGATRVLMPAANAADLSSTPPELLDKIGVEFFTEPTQAAFKAIAEA